MREESKKIVALKIILALVFPTVLAFCYCLIRGVNLKDLYLPASYNNDCAFYYKLVDGVIKGGSPSGYFGFNESHALIGGFAAWSPLIVIPWALWGLIFGWSYSSVIVCNLAFFSIALAVFVFLSDIDIRELGILFLMLAIFPSFSIHLLNVLPEIIMLCLALIYLGLAVRAAKRGARISHIVIMFVISAYLTMTRPYMVLFMILPAYYLGTVKRKLTAVITFMLTAVFSIACNLLIGHYFTAAYFEPLFKTDIIKLFIHGQFKDCYYMSVKVLKNMYEGMKDAVKAAFSYGLTMGTQYVVAIVTAVFALVMSFKKNKNDARPVYPSFAISVAAVFAAIVFLLQKTNEGGRHIFVFAIMGIALMCFTGFDKLGMVIKSLMVILLIVFCARGAMVPTDYDIPIGNAETVENVEYWKAVFEKEGVFPAGQKGYDNTVIWSFVDYDESGAGVATPYNELYALPAGVGINCCYPDYVIGSFDNLQSRYIIALSKGNVAAFCKEQGLTVLGEHGNVIMFRRY